MSFEIIKIRDLEVEDIHKAMELVLTEGWNQTEKDWRLLIGNLQNICLTAEVDGEFAATATAINYSNNVAWIGMVLVKKRYRGKGISKMFLNSLFEGLKSCCSIKLDATPAGQPVYKKVGFTNEYRINRMVNVSFDGYLLENPEISPQRIQKNDITSIIEFDKKAFGSYRTQLIQALVDDYPEKGWFLKRDNKITGFVLGREGNKYHQIGPVSAKSSIDAKILITQILQDLHEQPVVIDILEDKQELTEWLNSIGFVKQRDFMRMFQNSNPFPGEVCLQYLIC